METRETKYNNSERLERELEELRIQLEEANDTIEAIRTGKVDALVVKGSNGHQLYSLKTADQTYRVFIEKMTEGAVTLNTEGIIIYCNSQFARMVDVPLSNVIGLHFIQFIAVENKDLYKKLFKEGWCSDCKGEVLLSSKEKNIPVQLSLTSLELESGTALSVILTDLSYQKEIQTQLKKNNEQLALANMALEISNHDLQQFASVASHDLQEPLRKIQIFSNLMKVNSDELSPDLKKCLEKIIVSSARMKSLIIDILNYSKLSATDFPLECVDLNDVLLELLEDFELIITEKKAVIIKDVLPYVDANKGQLRQVFQNIFSNALKFTVPGKSPVIHITCKKLKEKSFNSPEDDNGPFCLICIRDNGIGFDEKYVSNIFALFERLNSKDKFEGTGIGLAIAKKIIEKHNGLITACSEEGKGSEFRFILPIKQAPK